MTPTDQIEIAMVNDTQPRPLRASVLRDEMMVSVPLDQVQCLEEVDERCGKVRLLSGAELVLDRRSFDRVWTRMATPR